MITKFDRSQIASISNIASQNINKNIAVKNREIEVPKEETFRNIYDKAKGGNEFAAVLLDEWQRNCCPKNDKEKHIVSLIEKAADKLFK